MEYDVASASALLVRTPATLRALLAGLPDTWLDAPEGEGAWSARDVACHLADLERDGWLPRVRWILERGTDAPLPSIERERFRAMFAGVSIESVLDEFQRLRSDNVRALAELHLDSAALRRTGRHESFGTVTTAQLLSTWVVHDLTHLAQVARALAAQYRDAVGPWVEFLSVLRR